MCENRGREVRSKETHHNYKPRTVNSGGVFYCPKEMNILPEQKLWQAVVRAALDDDTEESREWLQSLPSAFWYAVELDDPNDKEPPSDYGCYRTPAIFYD